MPKSIGVFLCLRKKRRRYPLVGYVYSGRADGQSFRNLSPAAANVLSVLAKQKRITR